MLNTFLNVSHVELYRLIRISAAFTPYRTWCDFTFLLTMASREQGAGERESVNDKKKIHPERDERDDPKTTESKGNKKRHDIAQCECKCEEEHLIEVIPATIEDPDLRCHIRCRCTMCGPIGVEGRRCRILLNSAGATFSQYSHGQILCSECKEHHGKRLRSA